MTLEPAGTWDYRSRSILLLPFFALTAALAFVSILLALSTVRFDQRINQIVSLRSSAVGASHMTSVYSPQPTRIMTHYGSLVSVVPVNSGDDDPWTFVLAGAPYEADQIWPNPGQTLNSGMHVWFKRSVPFSLQYAGNRIVVRGHGTTVGEALSSVGIYLVGRDFALPESGSPISSGQTLVVNRVEERVEIEQDTTSYETFWEPDANLELDQTRVAREGQEGVVNTRYKVILINGEVAERRFEDTWVHQEAMDRLMAYGTKVVLRGLDTPQGPQQYWRSVRVLVTSYSPSTAGTPSNSPHYGLTRTGKVARTGMIAVDPSVIPMGTRIYVPGYGIGVAEDTGSAIIGRHIDVCYNDEELVNWYRWVDIYLLTPVPPEGLIRWVLPNWPKER